MEGDKRLTSFCQALVSVEQTFLLPENFIDKVFFSFDKAKDDWLLRERGFGPTREFPTLKEQINLARPQPHPECRHYLCHDHGRE